MPGDCRCGALGSSHPKWQVQAGLSLCSAELAYWYLEDTGTQLLGFGLRFHLMLGLAETTESRTRAEIGFASMNALLSDRCASEAFLLHDKGHILLLKASLSR